MSFPATPSQTVGPFFSFGLCERAAHELVLAGTPGAIEITGRVLDGAGEPVPDALIEIWHADTGWGRCATGAGGEFGFRTVKPGGSRGQAPHVNVLAFARGLLKPVLTRIYFPDEIAANDADPVLGGIGDPDARASLIATEEDGKLRFDVRLQGDRQTVFFAL